MMGGMNTQSSAKALLVGATVVLLAGCTLATPFGLSELTETQSAEDQLPAGVDDAALDASSSRLIDEADGVKYFAVRSSDDICLLVYVSGDTWSSGCSTDLPIDVELGGYPTARLSTGSVDSDAWRSVGKRISVEKTP